MSNRYIILNGHHLIDVFDLEHIRGVATDHSTMAVLGKPNVDQLTPARVALERFQQVKNRLPTGGIDAFLYVKVGGQDEVS